MNSIPAIASVWQRKDNHNRCVVYEIANKDFRGKHKKDFPTMVIFISHKKILALTVEKFNELMEECPR